MPRAGEDLGGGELTGTSRSLLIEAGTFRRCGDGETGGLLGDAEASLVMDGIPDLGFGAGEGDGEGEADADAGFLLKKPPGIVRRRFLSAAAAEAAAEVGEDGTASFLVLAAVRADLGLVCRERWGEGEGLFLARREARLALFLAAETGVN